MKARLTGVALGACVLSGSVAVAHAQDGFTVQGPRPARETTYILETGPNVPIAVTGLALFVASYGAAVIAAADTNRSSDHKLFIPLVGPWLDIGKTGTCANAPCTGRAADAVLIALDGSVQAVGLVLGIAGLLAPEHRVIPVLETGKNTRIELSPTGGAAGAGLSARGNF